MGRCIVRVRFAVKDVAQHVEQQQTHGKGGVGKHVHAPLKFIHRDLHTERI